MFQETNFHQNYYIPCMKLTVTHSYKRYLNKNKLDRQRKIFVLPDIQIKC